MYPVGFLYVPVELTQEFGLKESLTMALLAMASPVLVTSSWWLSINIALLKSKLRRFSQLSTDLVPDDQFATIPTTRRLIAPPLAG